jgi:hypothetical protein
MIVADPKRTILEFPAALRMTYAHMQRALATLGLPPWRFQHVESALASEADEEDEMLWTSLHGLMTVLLCFCCTAPRAHGPDGGSWPIGKLFGSRPPVKVKV